MTNVMCGVETNFNRPDGTRVSRRLLQAVNDLPKISRLSETKECHRW